MRLSATRVAAIAQSRGLGNPLWDLAGELPSLDQRFAEDKSLVDAISGQNLITFSRASGATYVDSQGVIRNAVTNLALRSEEVDNASWAKVATTVSANASSAPNGTVTADEVVVNTATGTHSTYCSPVTSPSGTVYTFSCYVKAGTSNYAFVGLTDLATGGAERRINLSTGVIDTTNIGGPGSWTSISGSVSSVGDGWYRVVVTGTQGGGTSVAGQVLVGSQSGLRTYTGNSTDSVYVWGAQLEQSSTVGEYAPTGATINSAPRFDHKPITGESLGLLVEESRANLATYSEIFDDASWTKSNSTITANATTAPDGLSTADKVVENTSNSSHGVLKYPTVTANSTITGSAFIKKAERQYLRIAIGDSYGGNSAVVRINLDTGVIDGTSASGTNPPTNLSAGAVQLGNNWYRVWITCTLAGSSVNGAININAVDSNWLSYTGDGSSGFYLWGAQLEAGAFPTSYIPTTASAVTRAADVASISGSNFSSWFRADEGTFFSQSSVPTPVSYTGRVYTAGTATDNISLFRQVDFQPVLRYRFGNVDQAIFGLGATWIDSAVRRTGQTYKVDDFAGCVNGGAVSTDTSGSLPSVNSLSIGSQDSASFFNGHIRRLTYWPQRLGNEVLQRITQ